MSSPFDTRRYLTNFDARRTGNILTDVLVIGSGVAGARAALAAAEHGYVTLVTKDDFDQSATRHAQGGIAAAIDPTDSPRRHYEDTMRVGCGFNSQAAVELLTVEGPKRIEELIDWGIRLDHEAEKLALAREGGHSLHRIVHARGDQTGLELVRTLAKRVQDTKRIRVFERCFVIDFITLDGTCVGAVTFHQKHGHQIVWACRTILATGGCGQIWRETTNPPGSTGDGLAAAFRAGATCGDMELVQFHPTTLYIAGARRELISEAVRGEGGFLVDKAGNRFMQDYHADADLAPRDVVSRTVHTRLAETRASCVYLDVRHIVGFRERFPYITRLCADFQIDVTRDLIPVRPASHYMIGGVVVDLEGRTSIEGLLCCGEAACNGVHGANRLASNSLLEGLVFGKLTGQYAGRSAAASESVTVREVVNESPPSARTELDLADIRNSLHSVMWRNAGIVRTRDRLVETRDILDFWGRFTMDKTFDQMAGWELQNQLTVARLVVMSALERTESLGVHYRADAAGETEEPPYRVAVKRDAQGTKVIRMDRSLADR